MIAKGAARNNPRQLAVYLMRVEQYETGEPVELLELQSAWSGTLGPDSGPSRIASRMIEAFRDWQVLTEGTQGRDGLYHAEISPEAHYAANMTAEQWKRAADILGEELGFQNQPRAVVLHGGTDGRKHMHVVWARTDIDRMKIIPDSYNYVAHEKASHRMELEFGQEIVPGKHTKRDREKQPDFPRQDYDFAEAQMAERSGMTPAERKAEIAALKATAANGLEFKQALEEAGYVLAQGERGYIVVDEAGVYSALTKNLGLKKAQVETFMGEVPLAGLPIIKDARALQEQKALAVSAEAIGAKAELTAVERKEQITALRQQVDSAQAFKNALEEAGYVLARGAKRDYLLVDQKGKAHSLSRHVTDIKGKEYKAFMASLDTAALPDVEQAKAVQQERIEKARKQGVQASKFLTPEVAQKLEERAPALAKPAEQPAPKGVPFDWSLYAPKPRPKKTPESTPPSKFLTPEAPDVAPPQTVPTAPQAQIVPPHAPAEPIAPKAVDYSLYAPKPRKSVPIPEPLKNHIKGLKTFADSATSFKSALEHAGFTLARGKTGYLIVDKQNSVHALVSVLEQKKDLVDAFMSPIALSSLPTPAEVRGERERPKTPQPPAPIAGTPAGWAPKDQELYDLERSIAQRAKVELDNLRELHARQLSDAEVQLDREVAQQMLDYKLIQDEQTKEFLAARKEHRTGIQGFIDALQSRLNPTLAAEKALAREKEFANFYRRLAKERADYEVLLQQTKREQIEFLHEKQAYERTVRENKIEEDRDRYIREHHEAKRILAEVEAQERNDELDRKLDDEFNEGPEPPLKGK